MLPPVWAVPLSSQESGFWFLQENGTGSSLFIIPRLSVILGWASIYPKIFSANFFAFNNATRVSYT
jgi:hypothetical protein